MNTFPDPAKVTGFKIGDQTYRIEFIHHALDRMKSRGITENDVIGTLGCPDEIIDQENGRKMAVRTPYGSMNTIKVVFERHADTFRVISAMWKQARLSGR